MRNFGQLSLAILVALAVLLFGYMQSAPPLNERSKRLIAESFELYKSDLDEIVAILQRHPGIERVNDFSMESVVEFFKLSSSDVEAYKDVKKLRDKLGLDIVVVHRDRENRTKDLKSVNIFLYREGFAFSGGYILSLGYYPDPERVEELKERGYDFVALRDGWYIEEHRT